MGLAEYRRKRNFRVTGEPRGRRGKSQRRLRFVIQKHAASHLHFDFRLELDGVLKSWAVPKGPSLDPHQKRLAVQVEDHPLEYGQFEGIIPAGQYGGGTVLLWDQGTWIPADDAQRGYREGSLKFELQGEKLHGLWMLVRRGGNHAAAEEKTWFWFKERDKFARSKFDVTEAHPLSVATDRDMESIALQANRVWGPDGEAASNGQTRGKIMAANHIHRATRTTAAISPGPPGKKHVGRGKAKTSKTDRSAKFPANTAGRISAQLRRIEARRAALPCSVTVQLATLVKKAPPGDGWLHEIKFDGYRMICRLDSGKVHWISRNGHDWNARFPQLTAVAEQLPLANAIFDGEVVAIQPDGTTDFQMLQNSIMSGDKVELLYYVFDLLHLNGHDLRTAAIEDRKSLLQQILPTGTASLWKYSDHVVGKGPLFFQQAARHHLEGIISKRRGRPYTAGRGLDWLKVKCTLQEEFVIGGFTAPGGSRPHLGSLLLGYYDSEKRLIYAGRVGTGFDISTLGTLHTQLARLVRKQSPFANLSGTSGAARGATWTKPVLVAQVAFSNWTTDRLLRHPSFQGLREDKPAAQVVREQPVSAPNVEPKPRKSKLTKQQRPHAQHSAAGKLAAGDSHSAPDVVADVRLSHPDKVLYPDAGITKLDLARYYQRVADWMLPHVADRLLSLVRCPAGAGKSCFFQKHPDGSVSDRLHPFRVPERKGTEQYLALDDLAGFVALVQMGVLEIHTWGSRVDQLERPDRLVFDLDPDPSVEWPEMVSAAKEVRTLLGELELESFLKTTGGKGLHVVVPIRRRPDWTEAKTFCRAVADALVATAPNRYVATMSKAARRGKIFVDYLRNNRGATAIAPYSSRAKPGAPVSMPLDWDELNGRMRSDYFHVNNVPKRLARLDRDPWAKMACTRQSITVAMVRKLNDR